MGRVWVQQNRPWKFVRENKTNFVLNTILPNANFGEILDPKNQGASTAGWVRELYYGKLSAIQAIRPLN